MSIQTETDLETADYAMPGWVHIYNANIDRLNDALLKINALLDVDTDYLGDGSLIVWNATASKWRVRRFK